jgi:hypothetical protein
MANSAKAGKRPIEERIYEYPLDRWHDVRGSQLRPRDFIRAALDLAAIYWRDVRRVHRSDSIQGPEGRARSNQRKAA